MKNLSKLFIKLLTFFLVGGLQPATQANLGTFNFWSYSRKKGYPSGTHQNRVFDLDFAKSEKLKNSERLITTLMISAGEFIYSVLYLESDRLRVRIGSHPNFIANIVIK